MKPGLSPAYSQFWKGWAQTCLVDREVQIWENLFESGGELSLSGDSANFRQEGRRSGRGRRGYMDDVRWLPGRHA